MCSGDHRGDVGVKLTTESQAKIFKKYFVRYIYITNFFGHSAFFLKAPFIKNWKWSLEMHTETSPCPGSYVANLVIWEPQHLLLGDIPKHTHCRLLAERWMGESLPWSYCILTVGNLLHQPAHRWIKICLVQQGISIHLWPTLGLIWTCSWGAI